MTVAFERRHATAELDAEGTDQLAVWDDTLKTRARTRSEHAPEQDTSILSSSCQLAVEGGGRDADGVGDLDPLALRRLAVQIEPCVQAIRDAAKAEDLDARALVLHLACRPREQVERHVRGRAERMEDPQSRNGGDMARLARDGIAVVVIGEERRLREQRAFPSDMERQRRAVRHRPLECDHACRDQVDRANRLLATEQRFA